MGGFYTTNIVDALCGGLYSRFRSWRADDGFDSEDSFGGPTDIVHCKIEQRDTGYGFAEPYFIHETLTDLVLHYRETSLVEHNDSLDVMLEFPLYGPQPSGNRRIRVGLIRNLYCLLYQPDLSPIRSLKCGLKSSFQSSN